MEKPTINQHLKNMSITLQMLMFPFEAEASAYVVLKHFGIDTSDYSFGYVCGWAAGKDMSTLKDALGMIGQASDWMIEKIEKTMIFEENVCMQIG